MGPAPPLPLSVHAGAGGMLEHQWLGLKLQTELGGGGRTIEGAWISLNLAAATPALDHLTQERKKLLFKPLLVGT